MVDENETRGFLAPASINELKVNIASMINWHIILVEQHDERNTIIEEILFSIEEIAEAVKNIREAGELDIDQFDGLPTTFILEGPIYGNEVT